MPLDLYLNEGDVSLYVIETGATYPMINELEGIVVGEYGRTISVTIVDKDLSAANVAAYTGTKTLSLVSPDSIKTVSRTVSFGTDGSNGVLTFSFATGEIDRRGTWTGQISLASGSAVIKTRIFKVYVEESLS